MLFPKECLLFISMQTTTNKKNIIAMPITVCHTTTKYWNIVEKAQSLLPYHQHPPLTWAKIIK